jgi:uncharacterized protein (DUF427 family)
MPSFSTSLHASRAEATPADASKGTANCWTLAIGGRRFPDIVWTYGTPLPESQKIAGARRLPQREGRPLRRR